MDKLGDPTGMGGSGVSLSAGEGTSRLESTKQNCEGLCHHTKSMTLFFFSMGNRQKKRKAAAQIRNWLRKNMFYEQTVVLQEEVKLGWGRR